jgi:hypothetical protein
VPQRKRWPRMGGKARAARHTPEELRAFAANAGRRPYKLTPERERRILQLLESGWTHPRLADGGEVWNQPSHREAESRGGVAWYIVAAECTGTGSG